MYGLQLEHKIGRFSDKEKEFIVRGAEQKKPQDNFLFNNNVFSYVSHTGCGYFVHMDKDDYATEGIKKGSAGRIIYIRDNDTGEFFTAGWEPVLKEYEKYEAIIGLNYTTIINKTDGILCEWTIFTPKNDAPVEMWNVKITTETERNLSVIFYSEMVVFSSYPTYGDYFYCNSFFDPLTGEIRQINKAPIIKDKINAATCYTSRYPNSYTCSKADFIGNCRNLNNPIAIENGQLLNSPASNEIFCAAYQFDFKTAPNVTEEIGQILVLHNMKDSTHKYLNMLAEYDQLFEASKRYHNNLFSSYEIQTGDDELDRITNIWSKQMMAFGAVHCRWGIKGFRDIVQHGMGYAYIEPSLVRETLIKCLKHQYSSGFAVRSFPMIHSDSKMKYNDSSTWLIYTITEYLKETGDFAFLKEEIPYLDDGSSTVLERLDLIVNSVYNDRGERGLVRMQGGDWNDSFTHVGIKGKGESVWLSMFLAKAILLVEELMIYLGKPNPKYQEMYQTLKTNINENAWDGQWYICAFNDIGEKIGSKESKAAKIFLNVQSWALISEVADESRTASILKAIDENLKTEFGYILNSPAYTELDENIGRLSAIEPGTLENATSYTHGNAFLIYGLLSIGKGNKAYEILKTIHPENPVLADLPVVPYVYANCYYGPSYKKCPGKMEHSWITGSVNWLTECILDFMLGIRRTYDGLKICPVLPDKLKVVSVKRKYRGCEYDIKIYNNGKNVEKTIIDGIEVDTKAVLKFKKDSKITVEVFMK